MDDGEVVGTPRATDAPGSRMSKHVVGAGIVLSIGLAACGASGGGQSLSGAVVLDEGFSGLEEVVGDAIDDAFAGNEASPGSAGPCRSESAITVTVKDGDGGTIATAALPSEGEWTEGQETGIDCSFPFTIDELPTSDFYAFSVTGATSEVTMSRQDLESAGWSVELLA